MTMNACARTRLAGLFICLVASGAGADSQQSIDDARVASISAAINHPGRSDADRERDQRSKPQDILALLQLRPGQTVIDVFAAGGYYSQLLAYLVGPDGKVLLHNNKAYKDYAGKALTERFAASDLPQVEIYDREVEDLGLAPASIDAAMMVMSYHDLYFVDEKQGWPAIDSRQFLKQLSTALKPGGKLLIVDHAALAGSGKSAAQNLHRIDEEFAKQDLASHGFKLVADSKALRNARDDRSRMVFDEAIRGRTDRFVLLFEKQRSGAKP